MKISLSDLKLDVFWQRSRRGVLYALYRLGALVLQNVIFSHIAPLGVRAMFMPALVVAVALFEGGGTGGYFGLAAGIVCDLFFFHTIAAHKYIAEVLYCDRRTNILFPVVRLQRKSLAAQLRFRDAEVAERAVFCQSTCLVYESSSVLPGIGFGIDHEEVDIIGRLQSFREFLF